MKENTLQEDLENAQEQIELLNEKSDSITEELNASINHNKYLDCQQNPKLKQDIESWSSIKNQLLSEVKCCKNKAKELETAFKDLERKSKLQVEKMLEEKRQVVYQFAAYKGKMEYQESEVKKLESELSKKSNDIGLKNNEIMKEREKSRLLESKLKTLEKKLTEAERQNKNLVKNLSKTQMEEAIEKTKMAFEARLDFDTLAKEKQRNRTLQECLTRKDRQLNKLLEEQTKSRSSVSQPKREAQ
ncbi:hypothetical protein CCH79_00021073, partial [Gambusia affinis]